jgi:hypothetical protein
LNLSVRGPGSEEKQIEAGKIRLPGNVEEFLDLDVFVFVFFDERLRGV